MVVHTRKRHSIFNLTSSLKTIGRSVARRSRRSIALQAVKDKRIRTQVLNVLGKDITKELKSMCSLCTSSILRTDKLLSFSWSDLEKELQDLAPTLYVLLDRALEIHISPSRAKGRKTNKYRRVRKDGILGLCAALLCRYRNQSMNLLQRLVSVILYRGGASKQACLLCVDVTEVHLHNLYRCLPGCRSCCCACHTSVQSRTLTSLAWITTSRHVVGKRAFCKEDPQCRLACTLRTDN